MASPLWDSPSFPPDLAIPYFFLTHKEIRTISKGNQFQKNHTPSPSFHPTYSAESMGSQPMCLQHPMMAWLGPNAQQRTLWRQSEDKVLCCHRTQPSKKPLLTNAGRSKSKVMRPAVNVCFHRSA